MRKAVRRAHAATFLFALLGALAAIYITPKTSLLLPQLLFYALLLIHTYLSVDLFSKIQTEEWTQYMVDALLMVSYIGLALSLETPVAFFFANLCLFIFAPIKYVLLFERIPHHHLLRRKALVDLSGTALAVGTLGISLMGYPLIAAWALAILFGLASIRYLVTHPLYKL